MSRIRTNLITNRMANGAPTVSNGLVISGVTTSTTFSGSGASLTNLPAAQLTGTLPAIDGSNLTNITSTTINNNADNRVITGSGTANTLEGESNVVINGGKLGIGVASPAQLIEVHGASNPAVLVQDTTNNCISYMYSQDSVATFGSASNHPVVFNVSNGEKARIDTSGNLLIGTTTEGTGSGDNLTVAASGNMGLTLRSTSSNYCNIYFSDATSGTAEYEGYMSYNHATDSLEFATGHTERLRINSSGQLLLGTTTPGAAQVDTFTLETSGHTGMTLFSGTSSRGTIAFGDGRSGNAQYRGVILYEHSNDSMRFATADTTQMNISSTGQITKPNQPSFAAYRNQDGYSLNNEVFPFNVTRHNTGSHFNTGNHRFTAPVAGRYLFTFYSILNTQINSGVYSFRVNNSTSYGHNVHFTTVNSSWDHVSTSQIMNLNANDYVTLWSNSNINWHGNSWQIFCGELLS